MQTYKAVIFDLDGTLVDTIEDIAVSMNRALELKGFPALEPRSYIDRVGWGAKKLAELSMPEAVRGDSLAAETASLAGQFYAEKPAVHSRVYPGIESLLPTLRRRGIKAAVLSNKPDPVTRLVIAALFPPGTFDLVQGDVPDLPRKPDPRAAQGLLRRLGVSPGKTIFTGDSDVDMRTARASGCYALGVSWGYRSVETLWEAGAQGIIFRPEELLGYL
jgi:phosphoglycolate phosphatase